MNIHSDIINELENKAKIISFRYYNRTGKSLNERIKLLEDLINIITLTSFDKEIENFYNFSLAFLNLKGCKNDSKYNSNTEYIKIKDKENFKMKKPKKLERIEALEKKVDQLDIEMHLFDKKLEQTYINCLVAYFKSKIYKNRINNSKLLKEFEDKNKNILEKIEKIDSSYITGISKFEIDDLVKSENQYVFMSKIANQYQDNK